MSLIITRRIWDQSSHRGSALVTLLALGDFANDNGESWPGVETLAKRARITARAVQFILQQLRDSGEITIEPATGPHGCNTYQILLADGGVKAASPPVKPVSPPVKPTSPVKPASQRGEARFTGGVKPASQRGEAGFTRTIIDPSFNHQEPPLRLPITKAPKKSKPFPAEVEAWNRLADRCPTLSHVKEVTQSRRVRLKVIDGYWRAHYLEALERIAKSNFLLGKGPHGWTANFDWMLRPDSVVRIMEGRYDNPPPPAAVPQFTSGSIDPKTI